MKKIRLLKIKIMMFITLILIVILASGCEGNESLEADKIIDNLEISSFDNSVNSVKDDTIPIKYNKGNEESDNNLMERGEDEAKNNQENLFIEVYYQDVEGLIIPITRRIPKQLSVAKSSIIGIIDTSINRESMSYFGLVPVLPMGTEFTINIKDKIAIIDFNEKVLDYDNKKLEQNIITSIVYTLTQFDSIDKVKILINGYEQDKLKYGTDISEELGREDIIINPQESDSINLQRGRKKLDVYLLKIVKHEDYEENEDIFLVPVSILKNSADKVNEIGYMLEYLNEYEEKGNTLFSALNNGIKLIKSKIEDNVLVLDLNINATNYEKKDGIKYGGTLNEYYMVHQILHSMKQIDDIDKIKILVDGKVTALPEGTNIEDIITIPNTINDIVDDY